MSQTSIAAQQYLTACCLAIAVWAAGASMPVHEQLISCLLASALHASLGVRFQADGQTSSSRASHLLMPTQWLSLWTAARSGRLVQLCETQHEAQHGFAMGFALECESASRA